MRHHAPREGFLPVFTRPDESCFAPSRRVFVALLSVLCALAGGAHGELSALEGTIIFSSDRSGPWRIWSMKADGGDLRQITAGEPGEHDVDPSFNPEGTTILFSSTRGGGIGVWTVPSAGGTPERICDGDQASWSPDGGRIAFRRGGRIWIRDLGDGAERALTPEDWKGCSGPSWSPDGAELAFAAQFDGKNGLYLIPVSGGAPKLLYGEKGACEPHFTPDGSLIVYETESNICTIRPDGEKNRMVTFLAGVQRYGRTSPDGKYIVYCQGVSESGPWELYVVPIAGGYPTQLTEGGSDMNPDWK